MAVKQRTSVKHFCTEVTLIHKPVTITFTCTEYGPVYDLLYSTSKLPVEVAILKHGLLEVGNSEDCVDMRMEIDKLLAN
jgi:hypothetical protein